MPVNARPTYPINVNNPQILRRSFRIWDIEFYAATFGSEGLRRAAGAVGAASTPCVGANCREFSFCITPNGNGLLFLPDKVTLLTRRPSMGPASRANPSVFATRSPVSLSFVRAPRARRSSRAGGRRPLPLNRKTLRLSSTQIWPCTAWRRDGQGLASRTHLSCAQ